MDNIEEDEEYIKTEKECKKLKEKLPQEFSDIFTENLKLGDKCNIPPVKKEINENIEVTPTNVKCPRDVHVQIGRQLMKKNDLFAAGVIAESKKPTIHCAQCMF